MSADSHGREAIPFAVPDIGDHEIAAVTDVLKSRWITSGPKASEFERAFAERVGAQYAVAVNSCTAALHLSLEALGVGAGDLVYMSPYTFAASAEVVRYLGARPVFVDIEASTFNLDAERLAQQISLDLDVGHEKPKAIMPVHIAGVPCDMNQIWDVAQTHGLCVVEDAAHAFPANRNGITVGTIPKNVSGTVCFSFYATKTITTGEGGMLVTDDEAIANRARSMSLHGLSRQAWGRYSAGGSWRYDIVDAGYKYNLTDIAAAMGLAQLDRADEMRDRREEIAQAYNKAFVSSPLLETPSVPPNTLSAHHLYMLRLPSTGNVTRDSLIEYLQGEEIGSSVHFIPLHMHSYYQKTYGFNHDDYPIAQSEFERVVSLPIWSAMNDSQVSRVIDAVTNHVAEG